MSQYVLHGIDDAEVEVEIDMADYDFQVKYEEAFEKMQEEEKELQKTGKNSEITKGYSIIFLVKVFQKSCSEENTTL